MKVDVLQVLYYFCDHLVLISNTELLIIKKELQLHIKTFY